MELNRINHINEIAQNGMFDESKALIYKGSMGNHEKMLSSIREAIEKTGLKDGMTISFHHHFRNGDYIVNMV